MKTYPIRLSGTCPVCDENFFFDKKIKSIVITTTDCAHCNALLLITDGIIYPFHENSEAIDGQNTGSVQADP